MTRVHAASLGRGWGGFLLHHRALAAPDGTRARSYDPRGWQLSWLPPAVDGSGGPFACDIEWRERATDAGLVRWAPMGVDFWRFWVLAELAAKLADIPILEWLGRYREGRVPPLPPEAEALVLPRWAGTWTLGFARLRGSARRPAVDTRSRSPWGFACDRIRVVEEAGPRSASLEQKWEVP